jgi:hypothetical protein
MREVSGYLRKDAAGLEQLVGEAVVLRVVKSAEGEESSPQMCARRSWSGRLRAMAREGIEPPTRGFSGRQWGGQ